MFVLGPITSENLDLSVVSSNRNLETQNMITRHNVFEHIFRDISHGGCLVDKELNVLEEPGLLFLSARLLESMLLSLEENGCIRVYPRNTLDSYLLASIELVDWRRSVEHSVGLVYHPLFLHDVLVHVYLLQKAWKSSRKHCLFF